MKASAKNLLSIIKEPKQFIIPIYQRTYSWQHKQCDLLLNDIEGAVKSEQGHFIGSIVYFEPDVHTISEISKYLIIDGQQRLTTVILLISALIKFIDKNPNCEIDTTAKKLSNYYLFNAEEDNDLYYKLLLTRRDKETLTNVLTNKPLPTEYSRRIVENHEFFYKKIDKNNINKIYKGLQKLIVVDVALKEGEDNPQLIFESLNSTGLNLSEADLVRNYILMGQEAKFQKHLYETYWYPMEQSFGENISALPWFMRDYLTMEQNDIPKIGEVYDTFKNYFNNHKGKLGIENIVKNLYEYSQYYVSIALHKEKNKNLKSAFDEINRLRMDTSYPFLMAVYGDYHNERITFDEFLEVLHLTKNYVFRRSICGIPTNSLNKTFATLYKSIKNEAYTESVKAAFLLMDRYKKFPSDTEFIREVKLKDVYHFKTRNYLLESLENFKRKELVNAENCTIEHIIPQNANTSIEWQQELGNDWKSIKEKYLHTLGNLSLTAYNAELSDRPFSEKKTIKGGFNDSSLYLNGSVRVAEVWNEQAINNRAEELAQRALKVWAYPYLDADVLDNYRALETTKDTIQYSIEQYKHLQNDMLTLYRSFEKKVLNIDATVKIEFIKVYIAFKVQTNFVDVVPQKVKLRLFLNIDFDKIKDPKNLCKDVSNIGTLGNGDVEVSLQHLSELDDVIELVKQAFEEQMNE